MKNSTPSLATFFAACCFAGHSFAGPPAAAPIKPEAPENPLSFFDGKITFDLQERLRFEDKQNTKTFNSDATSFVDGDWFLNRFRLGLAIKPLDWLKIYGQGQDARQFGADLPLIPGRNGAQGDDAFDLYQGYIEIANYDKFPLGLKIGRQVLQYGSERLIGPGDWNNFGRSFDAAKLRYQVKDWSLDAFVGTVATNIRSQYNQSDLFNGTETNRGQIFTGLYFSSNSLVPVQTTDFYAFYLDQNSGPMNRPTAYGRDTSFVTLGARVKSKPGAFHHEPAPASDGKTVADGKSTPPPPPAPKKAVGLDYDAEFVFQTGQAGSLDLTAWGMHAGLGYTFDIPWTPRIGLEYNYGSGDRNPNDGKIETFQGLFPSNHNPYGLMDEFSWQNMQNPALTITAAPTKTITTQFEFHGFWLANTNDFWYQSNGTTTVRPLNAAARAADSFAGMELDVIVTWKPLKQVSFQGGYSHFFAGDYLKDTGAHDDADFAYIQTVIQF
jgi:hypothetical protein